MAVVATIFGIVVAAGTISPPRVGQCSRGGDGIDNGNQQLDAGGLVHQSILYRSTCLCLCGLQGFATAS